jgi:putative FmdB family regulatory protein
MPVYVYRCKKCGEQIEYRQSFQDAPARLCPKCQGDLHKVIQAAYVIFAGTGWAGKKA